MDGYIGHIAVNLTESRDDDNQELMHPNYCLYLYSIYQNLKKNTLRTSMFKATFSSQEKLNNTTH